MLVQFVFTAGTVVLGLFVASKVLGMDIGGSGQGQRRGGSGQKWGSGRCVRLIPLTCLECIPGSLEFCQQAIL